MTEKESSRQATQWENFKERAEGFVQRIRQGFTGEPRLPKKKKKNEHGDFLKEMARKSAKRIAEATPQILNALKTGQEYLPKSYHSGYFLGLTKHADGETLVLKVGPRIDEFMQNYPRNIFVRYNQVDQTVIISNLIHHSDQNDRSIEIQIAVFNEVLFEYDYKSIADLEIIGKFLQAVASELKK